MALLAASACASSCSTEGFDRGNNDISNIPFDNATMASPAQCCAACDANPSCAAWTFVVPPGPRDGCHLKFPTPPPNAVQPPCSPYCTSGHQPYPSGPFEVGYDRYGSDMTSFGFIDGPEACAQACGMTKGCMSWTLVAPNSFVGNVGCHLKNQIPGRTKKSGCGNSCTSGVAGQYVPPASCGGSPPSGMNRYGNDYKNIVTDGPDACCAACQADGARCASWTYVEAPPNEGCWLKDSLAVPSNDCDRCTSSLPPACCSSSSSSCSRPDFVPSDTCGAWIIYRPVASGASAIHQAFAYDNHYKSGTAPSLNDNSGYYPCGYLPWDPSQCADCGLSLSDTPFADDTTTTTTSTITATTSTTTASTNAPYCMGTVHAEPGRTDYQLVLSSAGLSNLAPDQSRFTCWFLDPTKGQALDCKALAAAETRVKPQWHYCQNNQAPPYQLMTHNCRDYVVAVMAEYCRAQGPQAPGCTC
eukprot:gnl/Spiro4/29407_TR14401_c0_g1_i1.p1 gnl/Spiro4/29407_TR14401_c0_g1~~gnl/Spiro4/29407_TR14401_c0_g1_i1.p1  ORF type:complete len:496 (-),score=57.38 gnl/Spiro4/29407_TR14401_c0_g1_i1:14-1429(-)